MGILEQPAFACAGNAANYAGTMTLATIWLLQLLFAAIYFSTIKTKISRRLLTSITVANIILMPGIVVLPSLFSYALPASVMLALVPVAVIAESLLIFLPNRDVITLEKSFMFSVTISFISFVPFVFAMNFLC
ncbi:MAG: hypothetical protein V1676_05935 [Candidatus Diapherotrites archaeon]